MEAVIRGSCWCCKDSVTVYQIIPEKRWTMKRIDPELMSRWVFEELEPGAENCEDYFKDQGFSIVIAGRDFGRGSKSVEHPLAALKGAGVCLVLAESFSRYSYRNAINLGLPVLICPEITSLVKRGDELEVNLLTGTIRNDTTGKTCQADKLSEFAMSILTSRGLLNYISSKRGKDNE